MPKNKPRIIDTNLLIRYLVEGDSQKADAVEKLLKNPQQKLILLDVTFAETIWVLSSFYNVDKNKIIEAVGALLDIKSIIANRKVLQKTLEYFANYNISLIDAYKASFAEMEDLEIYSYDKDFDKLPQIKRLKPV
ncbi:hypothetical protein A2164_04600 [Candidatus Curtissbacteria bacterium RBG_13_35_7]|uniref:PIN domain-containing protein n=1 Tax=Candidatus Curtissbacteria bacterium RBG_13_35_7 TaxID=1797705 RepID=A0A1F5G0F7_9BACT|nr:MAG: hypothetical protein A2164_04600 [Candidatus Curtissbacteria bacterium RBG_13_35_7]